MLKLIIEDDEGRKTVVPFVREEITIGRQEGNTIRLTERNVSRRHARLLRNNGSVMVEDLGSYNGIKINGEKISGQVPIRDGDLIQIGDYDLAIQSDAAVSASPPPAPPVSGEHPPPAHTLTIPEASFPPPLPEGQRPTTENTALRTGADVPTVPSQQALGELMKHQSTAVIRQVGASASEPVGPAEDLDPSSAPRLIALNTPLAGREFMLSRTDLRIGRTDENDICLDHRSLSRVHARIHRDSEGDWRILDLDSANGLTVNSESYAQSALQDGDVIELGHVRLRFVGPGATFRFAPPEEDPPPRRSKAPALVLTAIVIGGGVAVLMSILPKLGGGTERPEVANLTPPPAAPPIKPATAAQAPGNVDQSAKLRVARDALAVKKFEKAKDILESLRASSALSKEGAALLVQAETEIAAKQSLPAADKLIAANRLDEATELLETSKATVAFAAQYQAVVARLESARAKERKLLARRAPAPEKPPERLPPPTAKPTPDRVVERLADDGSSLIKRGQPDKAVLVLRKCIDANPSFPRCHKLLGSAYASLHDGEKGALHYRKFLELAPSDDSAPAVRQLLEAYEANKRAQTSN
ncbi:MAG: FHA domain-containing protein [Myxococcaceae bacterium]